MTEINNGLFIGRFQPFHNGHLRTIEQMRNDGITTILIGVGSCQESKTIRNPFSYEQRKEMIKRVVPDAIIRPIPDFNNPPLWNEYVKNLFPEAQAIYSGGEGWTAFFKQQGYVIRSVDRMKVQVNATMIREKILHEESIADVVPEAVLDYIDSLDLELVSKKYKNPIPTVDAIIKYEGKIVIIERKNEPHGYALPGGFVDQGECFEDAVVREAKEETNLDFEIEGLLGVYSDPKRDPRQHTASTVYYGTGKGTLKALDDAAAFKLVTPREAIEIGLVFDHTKIVRDYVDKIINSK